MKGVIYMSDYGMFFDSKNGDRQYGAESFREWCRRFFSNGVAKDDNGEYGLAVTSAGGRKITISPGAVFVNGAIKVIKEPITIEVPAFSGSGSYVVKNVVAEFNTDRDTRNIVITTDGPASGDAKDPIRDDSRWQLVIARIYCPDMSVRNNIIPDDITDTRNDDALCGVMRCSVDETNMSDVANTFRTYMSALGADEQAKYDAWFSGLSSRVDPTIFDVLDDLNAALNTVTQAGAETSALDAQVTALQERTARFRDEYKIIASAPSVTDLASAFADIRFPSTGPFSFSNLKKIIVTFEWPESWKSYAQRASGISLTLTRDARDDNSVLDDYNIYAANKKDDSGLNTIFLSVGISIVFGVVDSDNNYGPTYTDTNAFEFTTGAKKVYTMWDTVVFSKPLSESKKTMYNNFSVSDLKIIGVF